jgi:hypothetical protein
MKALLFLAAIGMAMGLALALTSHAALTVSIAIVSCLGCLMWLRPQAGAALSLAVCTLPLFVNLSQHRLTLFNALHATAIADTTGTRVHIGVLFIIVAACTTLGRSIGRPNRSLFGRAFMLCLLGLFSGSMAIGALSGAGAVGVSFYVQTLLPLLAWYVAARSGLSPGAVGRIVMWCVLITLALIFAITLASGSIKVNFLTVSRLEGVIPQYSSYFPFLVMVALALAISTWELNVRLSRVVAVACCASLPITWSRAGLGMVAIAAAIAFLTRPGGHNRQLRAVVLLAGVLSLGSALLRVLHMGILGERESNASVLAASDATRVQLAHEAVSRLASHPLLGDNFVPYSSFLVGGREADFARLFPTHDQYLDYGLRGGLVAIVLLVGVLSVYALRAFRLALSCRDREMSCFHSALTAIIAAAAVGNFAQLYVTQAWTGIVLFFLLGVSAASEPARRPVTAGKAESAVIHGARPLPTFAALHRRTA